MKVRAGSRLLVALAAVAVVSGCSQLATPQLVDGVEGKKYRVDGYGLDASLDRGDCNPEGNRQIEVKLKNNSEDAYVIYDITGDNLTPLEPNEVRGVEISPHGTVTVEFIPTDPAKSVSVRINQLNPDGAIAPKTQKIQGLDPRPCS